MDTSNIFVRRTYTLLIKSFILLGLGGWAIAGCSPLTTQNNTSLPRAPVDSSAASPSPTVNSQDWLELFPGKTVRDLSFTESGTLVFGGKTVLKEIPVSSNSDGDTYAKRLIIAPTSPSGRYSIVKACDGVNNDEGLCWAIYKLDRVQKTVQRVSIAKYGGLEWVRWSADDRYAVFVEKMEGTAWFAVMDLQTGNEKISNQLSAMPDLDRFSWTGDRTFSVPLADGSQFKEDIQALFAR